MYRLQKVSIKCARLLHYCNNAHKSLQMEITYFLFKRYKKYAFKRPGLLITCDIAALSEKLPKL